MITRNKFPTDDPFFISWPDFLAELNRRGFTSVELSDAKMAERSQSLPRQSQAETCAIRNPQFDSLDAFRPLAERAPEPPIAEAQRREFFQQLHRWLRQDYAVHVFCNNDGERQRFEEIWQELGLASGVSVWGQTSQRNHRLRRQTSDATRLARPRLYLRRGETGRRHRCGNFWALQNPAPAPAQIAARAGRAFRAGH